MAEVIPGRMMAVLEGDFVVFLIGVRINRWWKPHKWLPVVMAMPRMLRELAAAPDCGLLSVRVGFGTIIQYWRSFEHLEAYARNHDREHWPAWVAFNKQVRSNSGDVGIWHETFRVRAAEFESVYSSMPREGLALAGQHVPIVTVRDSARERLTAGHDA